MTGTISFGGIGSGIDTEGIVEGLIAASSGRLNSLKARVKDTDAAISKLSSIGKNMSSLATAASALSTVRDASAYAATSSSGAIVASVSGSALPGSFDLDVVSLAKEQRTYSRVFDSNISALSQAGSITIEVGTETASIDVEAADSLESIAAKINASGLRVTSSVFFDGTKYRLQVRGLDTGTANALTLTESTDLDLNGDGSDPDGGKTYQAASDAQVVIDGYTVTRSNNQIIGAIPGVTLALTAETTETARVTVASDTEKLQADVKAVTNAFNMVVSAVHMTAGFGSIEASNDELAGDHALRTVTDRLSRMVYAGSAGSGEFSMLAEIGLKLDRSGGLSLDTQKLADAVRKDPAGVAELLAEKMTAFDALIDDMMDPDLGVFTLRNDALSSQLDELGDRVDREETWLDRYAESLRRRFTAMDVAVGSQPDFSALLNMTG